MVSQVQFLILLAMNKEDARTFGFGVSLAYLYDRTGLSLRHTHRSVKTLVEEGYIAEGCKSGRAKTYYLTEKGLDTVKEGGLNSENT